MFFVHFPLTAKRRRFSEVPYVIFISPVGFPAKDASSSSSPIISAAATQLRAHLQTASICNNSTVDPKLLAFLLDFCVDETQTNWILRRIQIFRRNCSRCLLPLQLFSLHSPNRTYCRNLLPSN